jgi:hypothetical protein
MDLKTRLGRLERSPIEPKATPQPEEDCICFPPDERPAFHWLAEVEIAEAVRCPLHGVRFHAIETPPFIYRAKWLRRADHTTLDCPHHSPQYSKAWRAGFPIDLWPATVSFQYQSGPTETLILRDGTEIASGGSADKWQPEKVEAGR